MIQRDFKLHTSYDGRPMTMDLHAPETSEPLPPILFLHGFKGFKDWGPFNNIAAQFANMGFAFFKLNFAYNGTTPEQPTDFADLEAFGKNNFSKELADIKVAVDFILGESSELPKLKKDTLGLIGHSRGGGIAVIASATDQRIKKLATWAAVSAFDTNFTDEGVKNWKEQGVHYIFNSRTEQQMPLYYQLAEDFWANAETYDIKKQISTLQIPILLAHGTADPTVPYAEVLDLKEANPKAALLTIENGEHTFGGSHPFSGKTLPTDLQKVVDTTIDFFR